MDIQLSKNHLVKNFCFSIELSLQLCQKSINPLYQSSSILYSMFHWPTQISLYLSCVVLATVALQFRINLSGMISPPILLLFLNFLRGNGYSWSFEFPFEFYNKLVNFYEKILLVFWLGLPGIYRSNGENYYLYNTDAFIHEHNMSFHLLCFPYFLSRVICNLYIFIRLFLLYIIWLLL